MKRLKKIISLMLVIILILPTIIWEKENVKAALTPNLGQVVTLKGKGSRSDFTLENVKIWDDGTIAIIPGRSRVIRSIITTSSEEYSGEFYINNLNGFTCSTQKYTTDESGNELTGGNVRCEQVFTANEGTSQGIQSVSILQIYGNALLSPMLDESLVLDSLYLSTDASKKSIFYNRVIFGEPEVNITGLYNKKEDGIIEQLSNEGLEDGKYYLSPETYKIGINASETTYAWDPECITQFSTEEGIIANTSLLSDIKSGMISFNTTKNGEYPLTVNISTKEGIVLFNKTFTLIERKFIEKPIVSDDVKSKMALHNGILFVNPDLSEGNTFSINLTNSYISNVHINTGTSEIGSIKVNILSLTEGTYENPLTLTNDLGITSTKTYIVGDLLGFGEDVKQVKINKGDSNIVINPIDTEKYHKDELTFRYTVSDECGIKDFYLIVDGTEKKVSNFIEGTESTLTVPYNDFNPALKKHSIAIRVVDNVGKETTSIEQTGIKIDNDIPTIDLYETSSELKKSILEKMVTNDITGDFNFLEGGIDFYPEGLARDMSSGVNRVDVISTLSREVVNREGLDYSKGNYSFKVWDNVGHSRVYTIPELLGNSGGKVIIDTEVPKISGVRLDNKDYLIKDVPKWFKEVRYITFDATDDNSVSVQVTINGSSPTNSVTQTSSSTYALDISDLEDGLHTIEITATDRVGKVVKEVYKVGKDNIAPVLDSVTLSSNYLKYGTNLYFSVNKLSVNLLYTETGSGNIKRLYFKDGKEVELTEITESGNYSVILEDAVGNRSVNYSISDMVSKGSNYIFLDDKNPTVNASIVNKGAKIYKGFDATWYTDNVELNIKFKDNLSLAKYKVMDNLNVIKQGTLDSSESSVKLGSEVFKKFPIGKSKIFIEVEDKAGNSTKYTFMYAKDTEAPTIKAIRLIGDKNNITSDAKSGFPHMFTKETSIEVEVEDGNGSGVDIVTLTLEDVYKKPEDYIKFRTTLVNGIATFKIPIDFKGFLSVTATDKIKNTSKESNTKGFLTESEKWFNQSTKVNVTLPESLLKTVNGEILYTNDVDISVNLAVPLAGIRSVVYGFSTDKTDGRLLTDSKSSKLGDLGNLITEFNSVIPIKEDRNANYVWIRVTDNLGYMSETSRTINIDKSAPVVSVSYNVNNTSTYYNEDRAAVITVKDKNFKKDSISVTGTGVSLGQWLQDGDSWSSRVVFSTDGDYNWSISCKDYAGHSSNVVSSGKFTVDKTKPIITVGFDNNESTLDLYYKEGRTATVTVTEKNFNPDSIKLTGTGTLGGWSSNGDTHTSRISFNDEGVYEFSLSGTDMAGNISTVLESGKFIVDNKTPTIEVTGVQNGISYKKNIEFTVKILDDYLDSVSNATLVSRRGVKKNLESLYSTTTGMFEFKGFAEGIEDDDLYTLNITAIDKAGNEIKEEILFSINRYGSQYVFEQEELLKSYVNKTEDVKILETNVVKLDVEKVKLGVILNGSEVPVDEGLVDIKESGGKVDNYTYEYTVSKKAFKDDGKYEIQVFSQDLEGEKYSSVSEEYSFVLDTIAPEVIESGISKNQSYKETQKEVVLDIRDANEVKDLDVKVGDIGTKVEKEDGLYKFVITEKSKPQDISISVTDIAGNNTVKTIDNVLITSDNVVYMMNQFSFWVAIILSAMAIGAGVVVIVVSKQKKSKKES